ncbi:MAG: hypothetical protein ABI411_16280 [Tahibacter sp.]
MIEILTAVRSDAARVEKRTYNVTRMGSDGPYLVPVWETKVFDHLRKSELWTDGERSVFDDPASGIAERNKYREHLRRECATITYPAVEAMARLDALPEVSARPAGASPGIPWHALDFVMPALLGGVTDVVM